MDLKMPTPNFCLKQTAQTGLKAVDGQGIGTAGTAAHFVQNK
jgi:hypothetical protein